MTRLAVAAVVLTVACGGGGGGKGAAPVTSLAADAPVTVPDRMLALLPPGAQIVVELDLARLRANPVVGATFAKAIGDGELVAIPGDVADVPASPLASADAIVLAAYGVGTSNAATITMIASAQPVPGAARIGDAFYALGPTDWVGQVEARAVLALGTTPVAADEELLRLRDHAMPAGAPGASLRLTARLPFDARIALARQTGLESAPAQLSVWADVVDDFVIIVDADAADPGEKTTKKAVARLEAMLRAALRALAASTEARALGLPSSLARAKLVARGTWIRTIVAVGPGHLARVVARANALLDARTALTPARSPAAPSPPPPAAPVTKEAPSP